MTYAPFIKNLSLEELYDYFHVLFPNMKGRILNGFDEWCVSH